MLSPRSPPRKRRINWPRGVHLLVGRNGAAVPRCARGTGRQGVAVRVLLDAVGSAGRHGPERRGRGRHAQRRAAASSSSRHDRRLDDPVISSSTMPRIAASSSWARRRRASPEASFFADPQGGRRLNSRASTGATPGVRVGGVRPCAACSARSRRTVVGGDGRATALGDELAPSPAPPACGGAPPPHGRAVSSLAAKMSESGPRVRDRDHRGRLEGDLDREFVLSCRTTPRTALLVNCRHAAWTSRRLSSLATERRRCRRRQARRPLGVRERFSPATSASSEYAPTMLT